MGSPELSVVTGAFSYTGKFIARLLLASGMRVKTLTDHPDRPHPFGAQVETAPFNFDHPDKLAESLRGASTLYNTYWVRFAHGKSSFDLAVKNTQILFDAAKEAGVKRVVHISVTNPTPDSPLPYFRGKAKLEEALKNSGLSYAIIRPALIYGDGDVLINNIAWFLRHGPVFAVPGQGDYRLQPIFGEDLAQIAVKAAGEKDNLIIDAVGPEIYTFEELVRLIARKIIRPARIVHLPPSLVLALLHLVGGAIQDVVLTREEIDGLMADLLVVNSSPTGQTRFSDWLEQNADKVGRRYASELERNFRGNFQFPIPNVQSTANFKNNE